MNEKSKKIKSIRKQCYKKMRVAAYCRVSSKYESQKSSIEAQKSYYENYIRVQTNCIITKSVSRFSGNTVDMLQTIRALREKGVTVWFEKENIRSTDHNIELIITIHTMLAQEEIRNMSENIQWGFERRFEQGITPNNYKYFYGYDVVDGELVINEQQAEVVRNIFKWYLQGIISKEKFLETTCEMNRRKCMIVDTNGEMVKKSKKYNPQNVLGNILVCEVCGATYHRRTERGKVVYRCAARIEKGREACKESPTVDEEWVKMVS